MKGFKLFTSLSDSLILAVLLFINSVKKRGFARSVREALKKSFINGGSNYLQWSLKDEQSKWMRSIRKIDCYITSEISKSLDRYGNNYIWKLASDKIDRPLSALVVDVIDYLQKSNSIPDEYLLDDVYIWIRDSTRADQVDISTYWHEDSVGTRIKVFIYLQDTLQTTEYIKGSNIAAYLPRPVTYLRYVMRGLGVSPRQPQKELIKCRAGDILIFDTNGLHRDKPILKANPHNERHIIVLEFMDPSRSKLARQYKSCGPGQGISGGVEIGPETYKVLSDSHRLPIDEVSRISSSIFMYRHVR